MTEKTKETLELLDECYRMLMVDGKQLKPEHDTRMERSPYCPTCGYFTTHCECTMRWIRCPICGWTALRPISDQRCYSILHGVKECSNEGRCDEVDPTHTWHLRVSPEGR